MKGKVLFVLHPKFGHSTAHIRGLIYQEQLFKNGWLATFVSISVNDQNQGANKFLMNKEEIINISTDFDLIYLLKVNSYRFIKQLKRRSKAKIVFDLTDALWRPNFRIAWLHLEEILTISDAVFSENEYVCDYGRKFNKHVFGLPACTQIEKFDKFRDKASEKNQNKIVLGWIGTESTVSAIFSIIKPIQRLQAKYPHLELRILGEREERLKTRLPKVKFTALSNYTEDDMIREALAMDIGLFPAPSDLNDYRIRGALKALIYMSASIPAVCLNAGDPSRLILDGVNGMLINSENEWEEKIEALIKNPILRKEMGKKGYETVKQRHSLENTFRLLEEAFIQVLKIENGKTCQPSFSKKITGMARKIKLLPVIIKAVSEKVFQTLSK
jgi:glycosyltransferase involved in cell wall biosynthesis